MRFVREKVNGPILANMTEFGITPETSKAEWEKLGFNLVIYPVSALRISAKSMKDFYRSLKENGSALPSLEKLMTRTDLYQSIDYHKYVELDQSIERAHHQR